MPVWSSSAHRGSTPLWTQASSYLLPQLPQCRMTPCPVSGMILSDISVLWLSEARGSEWRQRTWMGSDALSGTSETTLGCDFLPVICTLAKTLGLTLWSAVPVSSLLTCCCPSLTHVAVPDNRAGGLRGEENQLSEHSPPRACQLPGSRQHFPWQLYGRH